MSKFVAKFRQLIKQDPSGVGFDFLNSFLSKCDVGAWWELWVVMGQQISGCYVHKKPKTPKSLQALGK